MVIFKVEHQSLIWERSNISMYTTWCSHFSYWESESIMRHRIH